MKIDARRILGVACIIVTILLYHALNFLPKEISVPINSMPQKIDSSTIFIIVVIGLWIITTMGVKITMIIGKKFKRLNIFSIVLFLSVIILVIVLGGSETGHTHSVYIETLLNLQIFGFPVVDFMDHQDIL